MKINLRTNRVVLKLSFARYTHSYYCYYIESHLFKIVSNIYYYRYSLLSFFIKLFLFLQTLNFLKISNI